MIVMSWFELVQTLIQTIPFPMNIVDENGEILFQNDVFKDMVNGDMVGKKCWEIYRDQKIQCPDCPLRRPIEIGKSETHTSENILSGRTFNVHHTGMMFKGKKATLEIFIDITDRKEITDELKRSEQQFRELFGNMEQGFAVHEMLCDKNGYPIDYRYTMVNEAFEKLTGLKGKEIVGKTIKDAVPDIEDYWIENFGKVAKTGKPEQFEDYFSYAKKYFNVTAYSPKKNTFAVIFYDVTEFIESQRKIEEKEKFIESILNVCPSVIYVYDLIDKKNVYCNMGIEDVLGYSVEEVEEMGNNLLETLMHPKDFDNYVKKIIPKYRRLKDKTLKHEYRAKHKNGRYVRLLATEVIYKTDDKGKPTQITGNIVKI